MGGEIFFAIINQMNKFYLSSDNVLALYTCFSIP